MLSFAPDSRTNVFRRRRIERLQRLVRRHLSAHPRCRIIDLGGTAYFWSIWGDDFDWSRTSVLTINAKPSAFEAASGLNVRAEQGDATRLDHFDDMSFDIVFSNSVIEHVGRQNMQAFADTVRRLAPVYMVQTPNYWFPIEPHARTPFVHWLPERAAARIVMARKRGYWPRARSLEDALDTLRSNHLLRAADVQRFFPDAVLERERFAGLSKSLIAVRSHHPWDLDNSLEVARVRMKRGDKLSVRMHALIRRCWRPQRSSPLRSPHPPMAGSGYVSFNTAAKPSSSNKTV